MKTVEDYFSYLKNELSINDSSFCKSILEKVENYKSDNLSDISKMLFFLYKVEGIRIANYKEWQRL
jgi:hypothetical protein